MYLTHITTEGERWDQLAWKYYGNALEYERIVAANPQVPITPTLASGLRLSIPVIEETQIVEDLPPWKR